MMQFTQYLSLSNVDVYMYTKGSDESSTSCFFSLLVSDTKILGFGALSEIQVHISIV